MKQIIKSALSFLLLLAATVLVIAVLAGCWFFLMVLWVWGGR